MLDAIKNRRSVRFYRDTRVSEQQLEEVLKAGFCAPSGHAAKAWHVVVVRDQQVIDKLSGIHKWSKFLARVGLILVVCVDKDKQDLCQDFHLTIQSPSQAHSPGEPLRREPRIRIRML